MATGNSGYVDFTASRQGGSQVMRVYWSETYDASTWESVVSIDKVMFSTTAWTGYTYNAAFEILINGVSAVSITESDGWTVSSAGSALKEVLKGGNSLTGSVSGIAHNSDGSKTTAISIRATNWSYPGFWTSYTDYSDFNNPVTVGVPIQFTNNDSKSITLYTIAAASTISTPSGQFGVAQTITVTRQSSSFTHTLKATCLGQEQNITGAISWSGNTGTVSWQPPAAWMDYIPNAQSATCTLTCTTYSGDTAVGTSSISVTLSVTGVNPEPTVAYTEPSGQGHVSKYGNLVQGQSRVAVTVTPGTKRSATVASLSAVVNGSTYYPASPYTFTTSPLTASGSNLITATVKDSRGLSGSGSATVSGVLAYSFPALSSIGVHRCDSDLTPNDSGDYMYISYTAAITALGNANGKTISYRYMMTGGSWSAWTDVVMTAYSQSGTLPAASPAIDITAGIAAGAAYQVEVKLTDDFGSVVRSTSLSTTPVTMDLNEYGDGVAFGKVSTVRKTLDIGDWSAIGRVMGLGQAREQIASGAYLNDYANFGVYAIPDGTALNDAPAGWPTAGGGRLIVSNAIGSTRQPGEVNQTVLQELIHRSGTRWVRYGGSSSGTTVAWDAWQPKDSTTSFGNYASYDKLPDGTLIQWGVHTVSGSGSMSQIGSTGVFRSGFVTVQLPTAFYNTAYSVSGSCRYSTGFLVPIGAIQGTASAFTADCYDFYARPLTDGLLKIYWQAVGRWK